MSKFPLPLSLRPFLHPTGEQLSETERREAAELFRKDMKAVSHTFFSCPAVAEAFILHWMKSAKVIDGHEPERAIEELLTTLATHQCVLSYTFQHTVDPLGNQKGTTCDFSLFVNRAGRGGDEDFDCDEDTLRQYVEATGMIDKVAFAARLNALIMVPLSYPGEESFRSEDVRVNNKSCRYSNFGSDFELQRSQDRSIFFLCLVNFVVDYVYGLVASERQTEQEFQTAMDIFNVVDKFIREIRDRCGWILSADNAEMSPLYCYDGTRHDEEAWCFGVPAAVVNHEESERRSLLWLEWAWKNPTVKSKPLGEEEEEEKQIAGWAGLREKVNNMWRAKSSLMWRDYYSFFYKWDRERLLPILKDLAAKSAS